MGKRGNIVSEFTFEDLLWKFNWSKTWLSDDARFDCHLWHRKIWQDAYDMSAKLWKLARDLSLAIALPLLEFLYRYSNLETFCDFSTQPSFRHESIHHDFFINRLGIYFLFRNTNSFENLINFSGKDHEIEGNAKDCGMTSQNSTIAYAWNSGKSSKWKVRCSFTKFICRHIKFSKLLWWLFCVKNPTFHYWHHVGKIVTWNWYYFWRNCNAVLQSLQFSWDFL